MIEFILGLIVGLLINPFRGETQEVLKRFSKKLPHKMGEIVGLSEAEENFKNSLKETEDTKIL